MSRGIRRPRDAEPDAGPLYLLDGNSLVFRAFFALPIDLATKSGQVTNAVHGFTSMLVMLLRDQQPERHGRRLRPPRADVSRRDRRGLQGEPARDARPPGARSSTWCAGSCAPWASPWSRWPGFEADDVLATLATRARDAGRDVVVVTGDRDAFQLVEDPHVKVLYTKRGISDTVLYDEAGIEERTGVRPAAYPVLAALRGDTSDNLPGVPGVGEKTAAKLVNPTATSTGSSPTWPSSRPSCART